MAYVVLIFLYFLAGIITLILWNMFIQSEDWDITTLKKFILTWPVYLFLSPLILATISFPSFFKSLKDNLNQVRFTIHNKIK